MIALSCTLMVMSCAETGQDQASVPLWVAGTDVSQPFTAAGGVTVRLERADLAFGSLVLCAGAQAGELCESARLEWLDSVVVDATAEAPVRVGALRGVTGPVRSWMYDLGLSSQLTDQRPFVLEAARSLNGVSVVLEGRAELGEVSLPFRASVPIQQTDETELGVPVIRKSASEVFSRDVTGRESGLRVRFDPRPWVRDIDFTALLEDATCAEGGSEVVCAGTVEQRCAEDGSITETQDCAASQQACLAGRGCVGELILSPESQGYRSIRNALLSGERPLFEWL